VVLPIMDITSPALVAVITYPDDSTVSTDLIASGDLTLRAGECQAFNLSFATHDYDAVTPAKTIRSMIIRMESEDFEDQSAQDYIKCYPYTPKGDTIRALYYHNSYAGIDSVICTGDQQESIETTGYGTIKPLDLGYQLGSAQIRHVDPYFSKIQQVHTGSKPAWEIFALHDLLTLKAAYEYRTISGVDILVPIIPEGNGIAFPAERNNVKQLSFSYRYAWEGRAIDRLGI